MIAIISLAEICLAWRLYRRDPGLLAFMPKGSVAPRPASEPIELEGELAPPTRGPVLTFLLVISLIMPFWAGLRAIGRGVLGVRQPARVRFTRDGITVSSSLRLFGKVLREREHVFAKQGLRRVARTVRFPRLGLYLGLVSLVAGSYLGLRLVIDGARAGAPEYLGLGALVIALAIALDYALTLLPALGGASCRLEVEAADGPRVAVARLDREQLDRALRDLQGS